MGTMNESSSGGRSCFGYLSVIAFFFVVSRSHENHPRAITARYKP